jgi:hypothetical protein
MNTLRKHTRDTTVSTVGTTSHHRGVVHLTVGNNKILSVKTLSFTVSLQVVEENEEELASSLRPSALITRSLHKLSLSMTTNTTIVTGESNRVSVSNNVMEILLSLDETHALNGVANLAGILEVNGKVRTTSLAAYKVNKSEMEKVLFLESIGIVLQPILVFHRKQ